MIVGLDAARIPDHDLAKSDPRAVEMHAYALMCAVIQRTNIRREPEQDERR